MPYKIGVRRIQFRSFILACDSFTTALYDTKTSAPNTANIVALLDNFQDHVLE